ncbi:uncharacterized protein LOC131679270 [Topomyia yanbarensis]|uniref:uncharacterized protein LOC131679270 n=1 Tax=Topomyia yanbarensis TaxID=2498891 RepID=UPI00273CE86E|nr:uncharacterized protein LOC131679270 [Topomyia yanbarensis]
MTDADSQSADGSSALLVTSGSANEEDVNNNSTSEQQLNTSRGEVQFSRILDASVPQIYRSEYPVTQINGCRQYGPPMNWTGPIPGFGCEIYVKRIPPDFTESELVPVFERFGRLYEMRLMMDYNNQNRRYCFVRYTTEEDAKVAIEVLNHHFVKEDQMLEVQKSFEKCRLFVGNLPKDLDRKTIEISFRSLFPEMTRFVMHNRIADGEKNRGFAFMDFPDHAAALRAKKETTPGCMRMWDRDIKIVWANPQRSLDHSGVDEVKTLFVRNIDLTVNSKDLYDLFTRVVPRQDIIKISRVREFAFVELASREQAELVMYAIQGYTLNKFSLDIEWAMPPLRNSFHNMKNYDFDSLLRIKCIANGWDLPIILYGRVFTLSCLQYATLILRNKGQVHVYFVEIFITGLVDVQSRICEAIISLILESGTLPLPHLVLKLKNDSMMLVGSVSSLAQPVMNLARNVDQSQKLFWNEIVDLCAAAHKLTQFSFDKLYALYHRELEKGIPFPYLESIVLNDRIIGCLHQSFRCRPALNRKLDDREIILVLCDQYTLTNYNFTKKDNYIAEPLSMVDAIGLSTITYKILPMLPSRFVQASCGRKIEAVFFGLNPYSNTEVPGGLALCMPNPDNMVQVRNDYRQPPRSYYSHQSLNLPPALMPPQHSHPSMYVPPLPPPPPGYYNEGNLLAQAMQQLGFTQHQFVPPQTFFGPPTAMSAGPPPPQLNGHLMAPPYYF